MAVSEDVNLKRSFWWDFKRQKGMWGQRKGSSLNWLVLGFLYVIFAQSSIFPTKLNFYPIPPPITFSALKLFFYILKHNVPSFLTVTFTNGVLLFYFHVKKPDSFDTVNRKWLNFFWRACICPKSFFAQREQVKTDFQDLYIRGPTVTRPVPDPLAVLSHDNRLYLIYQYTGIYLKMSSHCEAEIC